MLIKECCGRLMMVLTIYHPSEIVYLLFFVFIFLSSEIDPLAWKEPGIGRTLTYFAYTGLVFFAILLIIEYRVFDSLIYAIRGLFNGALPKDQEIDQDVMTEKTRVAAMTPEEIESNNLVLNQVSKFYGKFLAVNQLSIGIQQ